MDRFNTEHPKQKVKALSFFREAPHVIFQWAYYSKRGLLISQRSHVLLGDHRSASLATSRPDSWATGYWFWQQLKTNANKTTGYEIPSSSAQDLVRNSRSSDSAAQRGSVFKNLSFTEIHVYPPCNSTAVTVGWTLLPKQRPFLLPDCQTNPIIGLQMEEGLNNYQFA